MCQHLLKNVWWRFEKFWNEILNNLCHWKYISFSMQSVWTLIQLVHWKLDSSSFAKYYWTLAINFSFEKNLHPPRKISSSRKGWWSCPIPMNKAAVVTICAHFIYFCHDSDMWACIILMEDHFLPCRIWLFPHVYFAVDG